MQQLMCLTKFIWALLKISILAQAQKVLEPRVYDKKTPSGISAEILGERMLTVLKAYEFGILGKADLEAALLDALVQASPSFSAADSYKRAEVLRINDQKYRTLSRRAGMWLGEHSNNITDHALFSEIITEAIRLYAQSPDEKEVRVVIDNEMERRYTAGIGTRCHVRSQYCFRNQPYGPKPGFTWHRS